MKTVVKDQDPDVILSKDAENHNIYAFCHKHKIYFCKAFLTSGSHYQFITLTDTSSYWMPPLNTLTETLNWAIEKNHDVKQFDNFAKFWDWAKEQIDEILPFGDDES